MFDNSKNSENDAAASPLTEGILGWSISRRSLLSAGAILGFAALTLPTERAFAWSSWTNATSSVLKRIGMGDCVHEDLVQISYARVLRNHANDTEPNSLLNPWAGTIENDARYAKIAGDIVDIGKGKTFQNADDLATRLFRENLAYLRIGSFWNDAAANTLADFGYSCFYPDYIPVFSGNDYYEGAWDVGQHIWETSEQNKAPRNKGLDALVQFTMNDRNNFIHGMLSSTANHSRYLKQSDIKEFALQWLGVAYEYARTGEVRATSDVTKDQAEKIFKGFIDTYDQLDEDAHGMSVSLQVGSSEASIKLPHRRLRLRALGMMCHTMEDFWCPAHTCRTYHTNGEIPQNSILAFCNYKLQNGSKTPMFGYHIPFDRYAISDIKNSTNWREALTRGEGDYPGTETLANVLDDSMSCLDEAQTYFNTLGMNESVACITKLLEYLYQGTSWDEGVRNWVDTEVMPTYFDKDGQSYVCDAGRRSLHTPTYITSIIKSLEWAYGTVGLSDNFQEMLAAANSYDTWQRGTHAFYSGTYNTSKSKYVASGNEGDYIWPDSEGESRLVDLVDKIHEGFSGLSTSKQAYLLAKIGCNDCHDMVDMLARVRGMLQEFNIDLRGNLRPKNDPAMSRIDEVNRFFESGLKGQGEMAAQSGRELLTISTAAAVDNQGDSANGSNDGIATSSMPSVDHLGLEDGSYSANAAADQADDAYVESDDFVTSNMAIEDLLGFEDGSYLIAVRDMDSLETSIMGVPKNTPGKDKLEEGVNNLTITYTLQTEFEGDPDYRYVVADIDYSDMKEGVYLVTGTVKSVSKDKKSLVLDLNGISEFELDIRDGLTDIPQVGMYICAHYSPGKAGQDIVGYDKLIAPGKLMKKTYPVAKIAGSHLWLLTNGDDSDANDGYRDYLLIDYGSADVRSIPQEGYMATVYYYEEAYGETTDVDERALAASAIAAEPTSTSMQGEGDELTDSAIVGYLEAGDKYGDLNYGNDVFHVASVIMGLNKEFPDAPTGDDSSDTEDSPDSTPSGQTPPKTDDTETPDPTPKTQQAGSTKTVASAPRTSSTGTSTPASTLPKTGDPFAGLNILLSAAAVAGTAMAAYSARRLENERGDSDGK